MNSKIKTSEQAIQKAFEHFELAAYCGEAMPTVSNTHDLFPTKMYAVIEKVGTKHFNVRLHGNYEDLPIFFAKLDIPSGMPFFPTDAEFKNWENFEPIYSEFFDRYQPKCPLKNWLWGFVINKKTDEVSLGSRCFFCRCKEICTGDYCSELDNDIETGKEVLAEAWCRSGWPKNIETSPMIEDVLKRVRIKNGMAMQARFFAAMSKLGESKVANESPKKAAKRPADTQKEEKVSRGKRAGPKRVKLPAVVINHLKAAQKPEDVKAEPETKTEPTKQNKRPKTHFRKTKKRGRV